MEFSLLVVVVGYRKAFKASVRARGQESFCVWGDVGTIAGTVMDFARVYNVIVLKRRVAARNDKQTECSRDVYVTVQHNSNNDKQYTVSPPDAEADGNVHRDRRQTRAVGERFAGKFRGTSAASTGQTSREGPDTSRTLCLVRLYVRCCRRWRKATAVSCIRRE